MDFVVNTKKPPKSEAHHCEIEFSACDGMYVKGKQTRILRTMPYSFNNKRRMFHTVYYMPVHTTNIESFEINVRALSAKEKDISTDGEEGLYSVITCTLHFKRGK